FPDEPARDDVGLALERSGLLVDGHDGDDQTVLGQVTPIAEDLVADLAGPRAVDEHAADRRFAGDPRAQLVEAQHIAVFDEQGLGPRIAAGEDALRDPRMA